MTNTLPETTSGIFKIFFLSLKSYPKVFANVWRLLLASIFVLSFIQIASHFGPSNAYVKAFSLLVSQLITVFLSGLIFYQAYKTCYGIKVSINIAMSSIKRNYFRVVGIHFIVLLLLLPILSLSRVSPDSTLYLICTLFGWGGVFLIGMFSMSIPLILFDEKKFWQSIKNSFSLVWGNWWRSFTTAIFGFIAATIIGFIVGSIVFLVNAGLNNFVVYGSLDGALKIGLISVIAVPIASVAIWIAGVYLFNDLKLRKKEKEAAALVDNNATA